MRGWGFAEAESEAALARIMIAAGFAKPLPDREAVGEGSEKPVTLAIAAYLQIIFNDSQIQELLQVNRQQDDLFFNREAFSELCEWLTIIWLWDLYRDRGEDRTEYGQKDMELLNFMSFLPELAAKAKYKLGILLEKLDQLAAE